MKNIRALFIGENLEKRERRVKQYTVTWRSVERPIPANTRLVASSCNHLYYYFNRPMGRVSLKARCEPDRTRTLRLSSIEPSVYNQYSNTGGDMLAYVSGRYRTFGLNYRLR